MIALPVGCSLWLPSTEEDGNTWMTGPASGVHSIRKAMARLLENADVPENVSADILGHDKSTMTYGLYSGGTSLKTKREANEKLRYGSQSAASERVVTRFTPHFTKAALCRAMIASAISSPRSHVLWASDTTVTRKPARMAPDTVAATQ
jgi:hypothetical protein